MVLPTPNLPDTMFCPPQVKGKLHIGNLWVRECHLYILVKCSVVSVVRKQNVLVEWRVAHSEQISELIPARITLDSQTPGLMCYDWSDSVWGMSMVATCHSMPLRLLASVRCRRKIILPHQVLVKIKLK